MGFKDTRFYNKFRVMRKKYKRWRKGSIEPFSFDQDKDVAMDIYEKYAFDGDLVNYYVDEKKYLIHKWHHYLSIYERYFKKYRGKPIKMLEIGVFKGGSMELWRKYFGDNAIIYGIDIDPACLAYDGEFGVVKIGSQIDKQFLHEVVKEMGGLDIVLDDGSHHMKHVSLTLRCLFPLLNDGGVYMVEDMHTSFWRGWGGGYKSKSNFFVFVLQVIKDMHHWYHNRKKVYSEISDSCVGVHIHDSIVVFEKDRVYRPVHSQVT